MAAARPFKYDRRDRRNRLRVPRESELPADPVERFKLRQEVIRRAGLVVSSQLYRMEDELEAVARACRSARYRRILLVDLLSHYGSGLFSSGHQRVAAKARDVVAALEGAPSPLPTSPAPPESLRLLRGGRA